MSAYDAPFAEMFCLEAGMAAACDLARHVLRECEAAGLPPPGVWPSTLGVALGWTAAGRAVVVYATLAGAADGWHDDRPAVKGMTARAAAGWVKGKLQPEAKP
jgi:hypothetical protein